MSRRLTRAAVVQLVALNIKGLFAYALGAAAGIVVRKRSQRSLSQVLDFDLTNLPCDTLYPLRAQMGVPWNTTCSL